MDLIGGEDFSRVSSLGGAIGGAQGGARVKMFNKENCSPGESDVQGSCLDDELVIIVAKALNKMSQKNKKLSVIDLKRSPEDIHGDVCQNIANISKCSTEACWQTLKSLMKLLGTYKEEFKASFKPLMPKDWVKNYNEWLSTFDIEDCLEQHMEEDDKFYFYGAVPIDFKKCSVSNLCSFDMKKHLHNGETKIGAVFNTDPSTKDGQHWISIYIDLGKHNFNDYGIYYFDSFGKKPSKEIKELIEKIIDQGSKCGKEMMYFYNDVSYQKSNAQCGMYSIHFIKKMLEGLSFEDYLKIPLSDKLMIDLRDKYFVRL